VGGDPEKARTSRTVARFEGRVIVAIAVVASVVFLIVIVLRLAHAI
jgi:hypothetical protein